MGEKILEPSQAFVKGNSIPEIFSLGRPGDPEEGLGKFWNFPAARPSLSQFSCLPLGNSPSHKHWTVCFCFQLLLWNVRAIVYKRPLVTLPWVLIGVVGAIRASNKRGPSVKFNENGSKGYPVQSLRVQKLCLLGSSWMGACFTGERLTECQLWSLWRLWLHSWVAEWRDTWLLSAR